MNTPLRVLHLEDDVRDTELLQAALEAEGVPSELIRVETEHDFVAALKRARLDLILADYTLPSFDGLSALRLAQEYAPDVPFLFVSGTLGEDVAIEALKRGATDYVLKTRLARLGPSITRALREAREKSERKQTQEQLNREQQRFMDLVNSVDGIVWEANAGTFAFSFVSEQAERVLGYTIERWLKEPTFWKDHLHPEDRDWAVEFCVKETAEKRNHDFEYRMIDADGRTVWFHDIVTVVVEGDQPTTLRGVMVDTTDRKRAEEVVRRSEKELRDVINTVPSNVWSTSPDGAVDFINQRWQEFTGLLPEDTLGWNWERAVHSDDRTRLLANWHAALENGQSMESEVRVRRADGEYRWFFVRNVPLRDELGNVVKWYGTGIDVEERKQAEEAVRRSEKQLRDLIETIPVMAFVTRADGSNEFVSRQWIEFSGLSAEQSAGSGWEVTLHPDDIEEHVARWRAAWTSGKPFESEARHRDAHGNYRWLLVRAVPLRDEGGKIVKWYGAAIDVEDRKRAEEQVRRSEGHLAEAERLTHTGSWYWNVRTGEVSWSREYCGIFGFDFEKDKPSYPLFIGRVHPEDRSKVEQVLWADVREKRDFDGEYRLLLPDGSIKYLHSLGKCSVGQSGEVEYIGAVVDITERKRAEEALRASEQLARSHVDVMMRSLDVLATEAAPEKFIAEMLRTIGQRLHARSVLLWLRDPQDDSLHLRLVLDDGQQVAPHVDHPFVKDPHSWKRILPFQEMLFTKGPVVCDNLEQDSRIGAELREYMVKRKRKRFLAIPMFVLGEVRGFIGIQHSEQGAYRPEEVELAQALAHHVMIAIHENELGEQRRHTVILEERTRMARDIHDTLAQGFTGVIMQLEAVADAISRSKPKKVNNCLQRASDLARQSLNEARRSVHALRPEALERVNFWEALKGIIKNTAAGTPIRTKVKLRGKLPQLRLDWQENLVRIGQEALTNTLKYAHADTFETRLVCHANKLRLEFQDDGDGFNIQDQHDGVGLTGMHERVAQMGGELKITSARGKGTKITVALPCNGKSML
jgi:PAS domain S-box-containing protein